MNLVLLTEQNVAQLNHKKICCVEKSNAYLDQLWHQFHLGSQVTAIIDENSRNAGTYTDQGRNVPVYAKEWINTVDLSEYALVITSDYWEEAYEKLKELDSVRQADPIVYYVLSEETQRELSYRKKYENTPLQNLILFRSGPHASSYVPGMDFADNARALFEYMLEQGYNKKYELVWLVKDPEAFKRYSVYENVKFLPYSAVDAENVQVQQEYYRVLFLAKYIFFTDAYGFARNCRKDQIRVQLWHGCGYKTRVNFAPCEHRYEYTTVVSDLYAKIHQEIYGLRKDQVLVTGYAKQDWLFDHSEDFLQKMDIPKAKQYIFWLPTFRTAKETLTQLNEYELESETGLPVVDTFEKMRQLNQLLVKYSIVLVVKLHPFQDTSKISNIPMEHLSNIVMIDNQSLVRKDIQINQILSQADALISDYSSAAVDYLNLDRPMAFMLDDLNQYEAGRGFVFDHVRDWFPGMELFQFDDLCTFIEQIANGIDATKEKRRAIKQKMLNYSDQQNCNRILKALHI